MSWKSFLSAGLLCVLASPAFAAPPEIRVVPGGNTASNHLNAAGNWVWNVLVKPDPALNPGPDPGTPVAIELGFQLSPSNSLVSVSKLNFGAGQFFDKDNPGTAIPGFEGGSHANCGAAYNNNPCGLQFDSSDGEIFVAIGSKNIVAGDLTGPNANGIPFLQIVTSEPIDPSALSTSIQVLGAYDGDGRVAQVTGYDAPNAKYIASAYDFSHPGVSRTAQVGDLDLNGATNILDISSMVTKFNQPGTWQWYDGDMNGDSAVNILDVSAAVTKFNQSYTVGAGATIVGTLAGSGSGSSNAVPEPASFALMGLALLGGLGLFRRNR